MHLVVRGCAVAGGRAGLLRLGVLGLAVLGLGVDGRRLSVAGLAVFGLAGVGALTVVGTRCGVGRRRTLGLLVAAVLRLVVAALRLVLRLVGPRGASLDTAVAASRSTTRSTTVSATSIRPAARSPLPDGPGEPASAGFSPSR